MKTLQVIYIHAIVALSTATLCAAPPVVSNIRASQRAGTQLVDIFYDVSDADSALLSVSVSMSSDGGTSYSVPINTLSGAVGAGVAVGPNRQIIWNAGVDWPGRFSSQCKVRIVADDGTAPPTPPGMVYVPAGAFQMGDNFREGNLDELPPHNVFISAFFMDKYEVHKDQWLDVYSWAIGHGYAFDSAGTFGGTGLPVSSVRWFDAVKWCNARSEKDGYTPVYYTDATQTTVYRTGQTTINNSSVKWTANGYRLPTEAEWEKAARGGLVQRRYPWGDSINGGNANFHPSGDPFEGQFSCAATPVGYYNGGQTPAGPDMANGFGVYDVAGNLGEWCWDWYSATYYGEVAASGDNPVGPASGSTRVFRGGTYCDNVSPVANRLRCASRTSDQPQVAGTIYGFRSVKRP